MIIFFLFSYCLSLQYPVRLHVKKLTKRCFFSVALCFLVQSGASSHHPCSCSIAAVSGGCLTEEIADFRYYFMAGSSSLSRCQAIVAFA